MAINKDAGDSRTYTFEHPLVDPTFVKEGETEWPDNIPPGGAFGESFIASFGIIDQFDLYDYIVGSTFRESILLIPGFHIRIYPGHTPAQGAGVQTYLIQRDSDAQDRIRNYTLG